VQSYLSLTERFRAGETTPTQELEARLARLDQLEPRLKAFVHVAREAARAVAVASTERWRKGVPLSPIDGMPLAIKDIIETEDMPTGQGSPLWEGTHTRRDSASVMGLRQAGAIILGKTTTTEYAATEPLHTTTNPHDPARTPGGSSSGSAAAVGAGIVPAALGTQVVGSTLRPASYNGCVGFKPTVGALNRSGSYDHLSQSCHGILAATPSDVWIVASTIAERVGGDPGYPGLYGPLLPPPARAPKRLAVLETSGWDKTSTGARNAFAAARQRLEQLGVTLADRRSDPKIEQAEEALMQASPLTFRIFEWELRWPLGAYANRPNGLTEALRRRLASGMTHTIDDYRKALRDREEVRARYHDAALNYDACITLAATGAAPVGLGWTGDPVMNIPASLLGVPALSLPLLQDENLPLGLQLLGRKDEDADLMAVAEWLWQSYPDQARRPAS
jgi:Asp-tRNA(Asn)/Glu-tRNA(Gln) amidotransferase A subunit family amidase